jgi:hypothetical protein
MPPMSRRQAAGDRADDTLSILHHRPPALMSADDAVYRGRRGCRRQPPAAKTRPAAADTITSTPLMIRQPIALAFTIRQAGQLAYAAAIASATAAPAARLLAG